ncbi:MAG: D-alanyl-D-alanine carboxypeptidase family protein [Candidatus Binataceae bacterium]
MVVVRAEPGLYRIPGRNVSLRAPNGSVRSKHALAICALLAATFLIAPRADAAIHESIVIDATTGQVLESYNPDQRTYPASLAKLMTLYLTFQSLKSGKLNLETELKVSPHAASQQPTRLGLRSGESISVREAILAIVTKSANDAAVVLAESIGGSEETFAAMMNTAASRLGMSDTNFCNASGLPDLHQTTTARDMAKLALTLIDDYPGYYHFFSVRSFEFDGRMVAGHDHLLGEYSGADGMKTGFTQASGFNLVTSAKRGDHRLIGVVMGGATHRARDDHMMQLLDVAFAEDREHPGLTELADAAESFRPAPALIKAKIVEPADVLRTKAVTPANIIKAKVIESAVVKTKVAEPAESHKAAADWRVVVGGAYRSKSAARRALRAAKRTFPDRLAHAHTAVVRIVRRGRVRSYRAHFVELSGAKAHRICARLRRKRFACNVVQSPKGRKIETASAN